MRHWTLLLTLLWSGISAQAYETKVMGGPGGGHFELNCPNNGDLAGMWIRYDFALAQLDAVCVATDRGAWRGTPRRATSNGRNKAPDEAGCGGVFGCFGEAGAAIGGDEGDTETTLMCPRDHVVYAINVARAPVPTRSGEIDVVGRLEIHCVNPKTGKEDVVTPIPRPEGAREYVSLWPADCRSQAGKFWASGLIGRAGMRIDALGLRCVSPDAPDRPLRKEAIENSPVLSPVDPSKSMRGPRIGVGPRVTPERVTPPTPPAPPPPSAPPPTAPPMTQYFNQPRTAGYERLHACLYLPNVDCGRPAAFEFCKFKGFANVESFGVEKGKYRSETIYGDKCNRGKCRVFTDIVCRN